MKSRTAAVVAWTGLTLVWSGLTFEGGCSPAPTENATRADGDRQASDGASGSASSSSGTGRQFASSKSDSDLKSSSSESQPASPRPSIPPKFTDVAKESGIHFALYNDAVPDRFYLPEVMGSGIAWLDFDGDGLLDLLLANGCRVEAADPRQTEHISRCYRQVEPGRFVDVTLASSAWCNGFSQGCAVGDFDSDGFPDLFIAQVGPDVLLHNNGDGTFTEVTATAGATDDLWSSSAAWFDADGDGDLDLYVVNYMNVTLENRRVCYYDNKPGYCGPGEYKGVPDRLWINDGEGRFVDRLDEYGMTMETGKGLAIAILDLDDDLRPEIYVANDMDVNFLFTRGDSPLAITAPRSSSKARSSSNARTRKGERDSTDSEPSSQRGAEPSSKRWAEVAQTAGCAVSGTGLNEASMGISCADFDGDGRVDIYLTHYFNAKNTLYRNLGGLNFIDDSYRSRAAATSINSLGFGTVPLDFDRDGFADLFVANGHVLGPNVSPWEMEPQLLWNDGRGRFHDVGNKVGGYFASKWIGRCAAGADYDNDVDLDLAITHLERPAVLLRNDTQSNRHFVGVELRTRSRIPPIGGRVIVKAGEREHSLPVQAGCSYLASSDSRLLFGLVDHDGPVEVEVRWPDGETSTFKELKTDRYWVLGDDGSAREGVAR